MKTSIKRGVISNAGKDDTARPVQQLDMLGKTTDAEIIFPYGVHANLPPSSLLVVLPVLDQSSNLVAFGGLPNERITVEEGEVVFFHPQTKAKIHFKANGDIDIESPGTINVNAETTKWTGNINLTGDITASGTITGTTDVVFAGISSKTHIHPVSGASTGAPGNPPPP